MSGPAQPPAPVPPPPTAPAPIKGIFALRRVHRRWPVALRAGVCAGLPVLIGWAAGDIGAGVTATLGAFAALYGTGRPYLNRSIELAVIAVTIAAAVTLGILAAPVVWAGVLTVSAVAMVAVLLCNNLSVGPPGAYTISLACAAGLGLGAAHQPPWHTGLLVLGGGAIAWAAHMAGALVRPRGPEEAAVAGAGNAVADFIDALGGPGEYAARHAAAVALEESWAALVTFQPMRPRADGTVSRLRELNHDLHRLFHDAVTAAALRVSVAPGTAQRARRMAVQARHPGSVTPASAAAALPLGRLRARQLIRAALSPRSRQLPTVTRVGLAALVAGAIASTLDIRNAYWAIAAAVLVLHQGLDWTHTVQRSLARVLGTLAGLLIAGVLLAAYPQGLWLVFTVALLKFIIALLKVRNYALAVLFITPLALILASGGSHVTGIVGLLDARAVDAAIGCFVALAVYWATSLRAAAPRLPDTMASSLDAAGRVSRHLASADVTTWSALAARRDLHYSATDLHQSYTAAIGGMAAERVAAERMWTAVVAVQAIAYRMLAPCWAMEPDCGGEAARARARALYGADGDRALDTELRTLAAALRSGTEPPPPGNPPGFIRAELTALREALRHR
jgi:uncharacterized membrane protein YccC